MSITDEERKQVVLYRLEKAQATLSDAEKVLNMGMWATGANRLYYAAYYSVSALLLASKVNAKTHEGIIRMFNQNFVKNGLVNSDIGRQYNILFSMRLTGDYGDCFDLQEQDVKPMLEPTRAIVSTVSSMAMDSLGGTE